MMVARIAGEAPRGREWIRFVDLYFLGSAPLGVVIGATSALVVLAGAAGWAGLQLQLHFAAVVADGTSNLIAAQLARGSTPLTAWPGWLASLFFALSVVRLKRGTAEPPILPSAARPTAGALRAGLRREYTGVRITLCAVSGLAACDLGRAAVYTIAAVRGNPVAGSALLATIVEAGGLLLAAWVLGVWAWTFRAYLGQWGAITE